MTRIILLLLVALTGPFCTFSRASTLVVPTTSDRDVPAVTESDQLTVTKKADEPAPLSTPVPDTTEVPATATDAPVVSTERQVQTEAPTKAETPANPTTPAEPETEDVLNTTAILFEEGGAQSEEFNETKTQAETRENGVLIDEEEGMGTGQLVGIVIGALIAVIVVIAVIILVVRRMGQYSTAKKRKPQKRQGISTLKRKLARQQEKKKRFWL